MKGKKGHANLPFFLSHYKPGGLEPNSAQLWRCFAFIRVQISQLRSLLVIKYLFELSNCLPCPNNNTVSQKRISEKLIIPVRTRLFERGSQEITVTLKTRHGVGLWGFFFFNADAFSSALCDFILSCLDGQSQPTPRARLAESERPHCRKQEPATRSFARKVSGINHQRAHAQNNPKGESPRTSSAIVSLLPPSGVAFS